MNKVFYILFIGSVYVFSHGQANMRVYKHLFGCYTFTDNREKYYMIILGIDPGYAILGWGVVEKTGNRFRDIAHGAVTTHKDMDMPERLEALYDGLREIIEEYRPEVASIEKLYFNTNTTTAINVGQARGVAVLACIKGEGCRIHASGNKAGTYRLRQSRQETDAVHGENHAESQGGA